MLRTRMKEHMPQAEDLVEETHYQGCTPDLHRGLIVVHTASCAPSALLSSSTRTSTIEGNPKLEAHSPPTTRHRPLNPLPPPKEGGEVDAGQHYFRTP
jgi:hypothetical protein